MVLNPSTLSLLNDVLCKCGVHMVIKGYHQTPSRLHPANISHHPSTFSTHPTPKSIPRGFWKLVSRPSLCCTYATCDFFCEDTIEKVDNLLYTFEI